MCEDRLDSIMWVQVRPEGERGEGSEDIICRRAGSCSAPVARLLAPDNDVSVMARFTRPNARARLRRWALLAYRTISLRHTMTSLTSSILSSIVLFRCNGTKHSASHHSVYRRWTAGRIRTIRMRTPPDALFTREGCKGLRLRFTISVYDRRVGTRRCLRPGRSGSMQPLIMPSPR